MTQGTLFDPHREELTPVATEQQRQIERVASNIAETVLDFLWKRGSGNTFRMTELHEYVKACHPTAPASADRILRDLRAKGRVRYAVVSRAQSLYRIDELSE